MIDEVKSLIQSSTGYEVPETENAILSFLWDSVGRDIANNTGWPEVPDDLVKLQVRMAAAAYISTHISQIAEACDMSAVKMIKEGEVSVDLSNSSPETILQGIAAELKGNPEEEMACFRKLRW